jgi:hypothetical protein
MLQEFSNKKLAVIIARGLNFLYEQEKNVCARDAPLFIRWQGETLLKKREK